MLQIINRSLTQNAPSPICNDHTFEKYNLYNSWCKLTHEFALCFQVLKIWIFLAIIMHWKLFAAGVACVIISWGRHNMS